MSVTVKAAWITGACVLGGAIVTGLFMLASSNGGGNITNDGSGTQIVGDQNEISVSNPVPKKKAYIPLLEGTDIHLGDNVYPSSFGLSYNPLTQGIYPQPNNGVVFFDKSDGSFKADGLGLTRIGQYLVDAISETVLDHDYRGYKHTFAVNPGDPLFESITAKYKSTSQLSFVGPTALVAGEEFEGNFYSRYAAVGFAKSFSVVSKMENSGLDAQSGNFEVKILLKSYHGGIREGQSENFFLQINEHLVVVPSRTRAMRDPAEVSIRIPLTALNLDRPNYLFIYVLPWVEAGPEFKLEGVTVPTVHFRDVGIISLGVVIHEV